MHRPYILYWETPVIYLAQIKSGESDRYGLQPFYVGAYGLLHSNIV